MNNVKWIPIALANSIIKDYKLYWLTLIETNDLDFPDLAFTAYGIRKNGKWYWDEDSAIEIMANVIAIAEMQWPDPYVV